MVSLTKSRKIPTEKLLPLFFVHRNGVAESIKMAELCETFEVNCAAHNYHGWLGNALLSPLLLS